jgi:hypothetical protein
MLPKCLGDIVSCQLLDTGFGLITELTDHLITNDNDTLCSTYYMNHYRTHQVF